MSTDTEPQVVKGVKRGLTEPSPAAVSVGADQVQDKVDADEDKGYHGSVPDSTPNANYTVAGVLAGKPTPETDAAQAAKVDVSSRDLTAGLPTGADPKSI